MNSPAFQFYPQDFLVGCAEFTPEQTGIYIRLLCYQWAKGSIPDDLGLLARITGGKRISIQKVLEKFTKNSQGSYTNSRLDREREKQVQFSRSRSENATKRWHKDDASALHVHKPSICKTHALQSSSSVFSLHSSELLLGKEAKGPREAETLEGLLAELSPNYKHVNFTIEIGRIRGWLLANKNRKLTKRFLVNWLNRIEAPIDAGQGATWDQQMKKEQDKHANGF